MEAALGYIETVNKAIHSFVWGPPVLALLVCTGIYITVRTGFFQITKLKHVMDHTLLSLFRDKSVVKTKDKKAISQFQAVSTALAATIGTGNIVGVATAIVSGGPGAVFWMWVSAFFGMMTIFSENVLGIYYRHKNLDGEWTGGPMIYLERGLGCKWLAVLFSVFCLVASFGIGNIAQVNSIATALHTSLHIPTWATGVAIAAFIGFVIIGGIKRIAAVAEKVVPFMAVVYIAGGIVILCLNIQGIPGAFRAIFQGAFSLRAGAGGVAGYTVAQAIRFGIARGVFSNEAGLGSSAMVNSVSDVTEPVRQGMWGIFQVFVDTILVCTITALVILVTGSYGAVDANGQLVTGAALTMAGFQNEFGHIGTVFTSLCIVLFAFSTILGWSYYGQKAAEYLGGRWVIPAYKALFIAVILVGATSSVQLVWDVSDTFNGLMAIPNLIGVLGLSPVVVKITKNYIARTFHGATVEPMLSIDQHGPFTRR